MMDYEDKTYGQRIAEIYDEINVSYDPGLIDLLAEFAEGGPALELGIGTGRIALPLHEKGVAVQGIDVSKEMIAKLHAKPQGTEIEVFTGSFAEFQLNRRFQLIYVVFNTFYALLTQEEQVKCFKSVAAHLAPDGVFLMEAFFPNPGRYVDHQTVRSVSLSEDTVRFDVSEIDPVAQQVSTQHVHLSNDGIRLYPVKLRYAWPSELDLMAQIAGLALRHRWNSCARDEFTKNSRNHISIYGLGPRSHGIG
jgi:SAM-dependent methyltransferase